MLKRDGKRVAVALGILIVSSWAAAAQELTVDGNVTATSFTGDGSGLTAVPDDVSHGVASFSCAAGGTCFVFNSCPTGFEVTGGGFFVDSASQATRAMVTMHQSYRATATQWLAEATNGSGSALDFYSLAECTRVPASPLASQSGSALASALPPALNPFRVLLACPESDTVRFVEPEDATSSHFCPNHGMVLQASGGGPSAILPAWPSQ